MVSAKPESAPNAFGSAWPVANSIASTAMPSQWPPFIAAFWAFIHVSALGVSVQAPPSEGSVQTPSPKRRNISTSVRLVAVKVGVTFP